MPPDPRGFPAHGVVVLAAGTSSRLRQIKQLLQYRGESLVRRAARLALGTSPLEAVIVVGAHADAVFAEVADLAVRRVECADWKTGMGASLRAGVNALSHECDGVLVLLCDQPALDAAHLESLCSVWCKTPAIGSASFYSGRAGVPALLPRSWFEDLQEDPGDHGARALIAARNGQIHLVANEALGLDIDRPADLVNLV